MNNIPRKCLGYQTPAEAFQQLAFPAENLKSCARS
jgi:IS30 family transposase